MKSFLYLFLMILAVISVTAIIIGVIGFLLEILYGIHPGFILLFVIIAEALYLALAIKFSCSD